MRFLLFVPLVCALLWALPALSQSDNGQPDGAIAVESDANQDAAIAVRIREIIGQLDGYEAVRVIVADGIVTLDGTVLDAAQITALNDLVARVEGVVAIENEVVESTDVRERLDPAIQRIEGRIAQLMAVLPLILVAIGAGLIVIFAGFFIARRKWPWDNMAPNAFIADIYRQIVRLGFVIMGVVLALDLLNLTALLGTILGAAGIIGLAIGFAVRDTVENFIASIMLSIRQPFRPKDLVEIEGELGHVIRLTSRATILLSLDGNHIRLPNATVFKAKIINYSRNDERRFTIALGIDPTADIATAQEIVLQALKELPFVLETPAPGVWVEGLGPSTIDLTAAAWIMQHQTSIGMAKGEAVRIVKARLEEAGIGLPEPAYRLLGATGTRLAPSEPTVPSPGAAAAPPPRVEAQEIGAAEKVALETLIEEEREALPDDDLLRREAPQE
jgi:small conductance mechanosensitive channel